MYLQRYRLDYKKIVLGLALAATVGTAQAAPVAITARFDMYDPGPTLIGAEVDTSVTGSYDPDTGTISLASSDPFFFFTWSVSGGTLYAPGTHVIPINGDGSNELSGVASAPLADGDGNYTFTVPAGHIGANVNFSWSGNVGIDVFLLWDSDGNSVDVDGDGTPGARMVDGPFPGFQANFSLNRQPTIAGNVSVDITTQQGLNKGVVIKHAVDAILKSNNTLGTAYNWDNGTTDAAIIAAMSIGDATSQNFQFDPSGLAAGDYTVSVTVTEGIFSATRTETITIVDFALAGVDSDFDSTDDDIEGSLDTDNDGLPDFIDNDPTGLNITPTDANGLVIKSSSGTVTMGTTALASSYSNFAVSGLYSDITPLVNTSTPGIATVDSGVTSSCIGGCFDFGVTGLANGGTAQVVIPLSAAIPEHAVYRKFSGGSWVGFKICGPALSVLCPVVSETNSIASAEAMGAGASQCPPPGNDSYTAGLTPGHFCVQLTMTDGGPNDAGGTTQDGVILDPGGIGIIDLSAPSTQVGGGGCSLTNTHTGANEHAEWLLLAGFILWTGLVVRRRMI